MLRKAVGLGAAFTETDWVLMRNPAGGTGLSFQADPDYAPPVWPQKIGEQRRMPHLEIRVDDLDAASAIAVDAGARLAGFQPQDDVRVFFDPAGHPFCLFLN